MKIPQYKVVRLSWTTFFPLPLFFIHIVFYLINPNYISFFLKFNSSSFSFNRREEKL